MSASKPQTSADGGGGGKIPPAPPTRTSFADPPDPRRNLPRGKPSVDRDDFIDKLKRRG